ncbi:MULTISPECIES: 30S ribosomal protein S6 [Salibacterium]|uniref:Small ribosomal subunit protein bS6 n=3 Tax=Salibacterium TaxID=1884429 RepID=A0A1I4NAS0_9BACI|nr:MULTISPECIES: 30S ribosomal protein S6 [Salibacterium]SFM12634.1 SSU ribosomal protein S6P [Salibacterium qingdaonense]SFP89917.1 small subunit ribosomal protein S6 [Salibacterium halotolerans]
MRNYEVLYIIAPSVDENGIKEMVERYNNVLTNQGAEIEKVDEMGKRRLAYEIDDLKDGYYVVVYIKAEPGATDEFERLVKMDDNVIRHLVVKNED